MPRYPSPKRYAQAVFQLAVENDRIETWAEDLRVLAVALDDEQLAGFLDAPQVTKERKLAVIHDVVGPTVGPLAVNLVGMLASRGLARLIPGILEEYGRLVDAQKGVERVEVITAVQLDKVQEAEVSAMLSGLIGKQIRLTTYVEPEIIGGLIARTEDRVIDGSVRTRLREMRRDIVEQVS